ncbi:hypothetical protein EDB83DRAFT_2536404 [Lactarius deliciosus]|nr:hypothetical protein EDB83DRAFT_2536404 [Lactarius deliciosus]
MSVCSLLDSLIVNGDVKEYESHFSCCGKTVEGDEDPPDGWCYKGMHTTVVKRAHFRADSTSDGDMLEPCDELDCHIIRSPPPRP